MVNENAFLLYALVMGIFVTFVYDILRIMRRVFPHSGFMTSLEDLGFWIYCAAEVFLLMYQMSDGTLRWFAVLGALVGIVVYKKLVSPWFVKYTSLALKKVVEILGRVFRFIFKPIKKLLRKIGQTVRKNAGRAAYRRHKVKKVFKKKLTFLLKVLKMTM